MRAMNNKINKKYILFFCVFFVFSLFFIKTFIDINDNGRYKAVVIPYERTYGITNPGKRDDKFYILDTRTGTHKQVF